MSEAGRDVAYSLRVLRHNLGFGLAVIANLFRSLASDARRRFSARARDSPAAAAVRAAGRVALALWERNMSRGADHNVVSAETFDMWRTRAHSFTDVAAMVPAPRTIAGAPAERIAAAQVSACTPGCSALARRSAAPSPPRTRTERQRGRPHPQRRDVARAAADPRVVGRRMVMDGDCRRSLV